MQSSEVMMTADDLTNYLLERTEIGGYQAQNRINQESIKVSVVNTTTTATTNAAKNNRENSKT